MIPKGQRQSFCSCLLRQPQYGKDSIPPSDSALQMYKTYCNVGAEESSHRKQSFLNICFWEDSLLKVSPVI